jgi:hypothetical protein
VRRRRPPPFASAEGGHKPSREDSRHPQTAHTRMICIGSPGGHGPPLRAPGHKHLAQHRWNPLEPSASASRCNVGALRPRLPPQRQLTGPRSADAGSQPCTCGGAPGGAPGGASRGICAAAPAGGCRVAPPRPAHAVWLPRVCATSCTRTLCLALEDKGGLHSATRKCSHHRHGRREARLTGRILVMYLLPSRGSVQAACQRRASLPALGAVPQQKGGCSKQ